MDADDVICSAHTECKKLKNAVHVIMYAGKEIHQKPEYCGGRHPHRFRHEEDMPHFCTFVNKQVVARQMYKRIFE